MDAAGYQTKSSPPSLVLIQHVENAGVLGMQSRQTMLLFRRDGKQEDKQGPRWLLVRDHGA